jgi:trichothecene 3-O-acetyltransferase
MDWQSTFVTPSVPLIPGWMKLTPLDQFENRFIVPMVLIFHISSPALRQPILRDLKTSLADTIGEMSFLAANVVPDCEEQDTIQLEISDDAGVWFHSQELPEIDYYALERREFPPSAFPLLSLMPEPRVHRSERSPVLTVLATFISGGLLLTFNNHHSAMDGAGMATLAQTFAKHVAALSDGRFISSEDAFPEEALDRSNIFGGSGRKEICDFPSYRLSKTYRCTVERELIEAAITGDHPKLQLLQKLQLSLWFISNESMRAMREAALPLSKGLPVLTDNTIMCAVLWRHVSRARQLSSRGIMTNSFINTVNARRRMDPPLPLEYPGNALVHAKTSAATADVESAEPGMLYKLAKQITDAIEWWTSERVWELIGAIESSQMVSKVEPNMDNFQGPDLEVTSTAAMGDVSRVDWGCELGRVKALRYVYVPVKDGWVNVLPRRNDAGIELIIGLEKSATKRLRQDKEWLQLAQEFL